MSLFRGLWRGVTVLKETMGNLLFLLILVLILAAVFGSDRPTVEPLTALILNPRGVVVEQARPVDPINELLGDNSSEATVRDMLASLARGRDDDRISALVIDTSRLQSISLGQLEEIGNGISQFKDSGKPVYAFGSGYSQSQYFLAAHADKVILDGGAFNALGGVFFTGLGVYPTYYGKAIDRLKVDINLFVAGDFKDAAEPFRLEAMSERSREATSAWLGGLWQSYLSKVAALRNLNSADVENYITNYAELLSSTEGNSAQLALQEGLIDAVMTQQEWQSEMRGVSASSGRTFRQIGFEQYLADSDGSLSMDSLSQDKVAIITASGTILDGEQPVGRIGGETLVKLIRQAQFDGQVKAVVVRLNTPGGSAAASEQIRQALSSLQDAGKPVVVSMAGYAASGGYWIASTSNRIYSQETTVTGSIGTFLMFPTFERSLAEIGVFTDGVGTTEFSSAFDSFQTIRPAMQAALETSVQSTYRKFIGLVASGRDISLDRANEVAQGKVWSGKRAVELGLVDAIGGLDDAVEAAAQLAGLSSFHIQHLEKELSPRERLLKELMSGGMGVLVGSDRFQTNLMDRVIPEELALMLRMSESPGVYAACLVCNVR